MNSLGWLAQDAGTLMPMRFARSGAMPTASLFENNAYIRLLNQLLLMELGAAQLFEVCSLTLTGVEANSFLQTHQRQAKCLSTLIINNRGLPEKDRFSFSSEISLFASRIGKHLPSTFARRTKLSSCIRLEKSMRRGYLLAISQAPARDISQLGEHLRRIKSHIEVLESSSSLEAQ